MILGGGQAQADLIKTAKAMGLYVICVGTEGKYPGYDYADKVYHVDIFNKHAVLEVAKKEKIDGISMVCSDFGLETVGFVNDQLKLSGISENVAAVAANKLLMKQKLEEAGVNTAKYRVVRNQEDIKEVVQVLQFPLIVKAVDLQGSRGVYVCHTKESLYENFQKSIDESKCDYCLVEEFIEGEEFGAQAFIEDGEVLFVEPHGDEVLRNGQVNVPTGHYMPLFGHEDPKYKLIEDFSKKAIKAIGFDNCAVNIDLIMRDNQPYIIELTGRAGANFLPELTSTYLGLNYYQMVIKEAIGETVKDYYEYRNNGAKAVLARMLYSEKSGIIRKIQVEQDENIKICILYVSEGDAVNRFSNSRDCIGKILTVGNSKIECRQFADNFIKNKLKIELL